jgi:hypothetical protein
VEDEDDGHSTSEEKKIGHCCCSRTTSNYVLLSLSAIAMYVYMLFVIEQCVSNPYNARYQLRGRRMKSRTKRGIVAT